MEVIQRKTCVHFWEDVKTDDGNYLEITTNASHTCEADPGYLKKPAQNMNLNRDCMNSGAIYHELMHVLGFHHEHQKPGRGKYVDVNTNNYDLKKNAWFFREMSPGEVTVLGVDYDYNSVLHYAAYAGSINGKQVIKPLKPGGENIGKATVLSRTDIRKINKFYNCAITSHENELHIVGSEDWKEFYGKKSS